MTMHEQSISNMRDNQVVVFAIIHTRRKPGYWKNRMFDVLPDRK
jgi:hypothetical protein